MTKFRSILLVCANVALLTGAAKADEQATPSLNGDLGPTLLQLAGALILIVIIIYASLWLMKRYSLGKMTGGGNLINIVERKHLTPKQAIYLIKVGENHLLIGASDSGLSKLSDVELPEVPTQPTGRAATPPPARFSQILKQAKGSLLPMFTAKEKSVEA